MATMIVQILVLGIGAALTSAVGYDYAPAYGYKPAYSQPEAAYDAYAQPQPYSFGYETKDAHGNKQFRQEDSDASGAKKGSYGYTDAHGVYRTVHYVADKHGFRAWIATNEPGTANQNPADVEVNAVEAPHHHAAPAYAPALYHAAPVHYDSYGSAPVAYKAAYKAPVVYKSPAVVYKAPVAYKTPVAYKSPVVYHGSSPQVYKLPAYGYKPHYRKYDDVY